MWDGLSSLNINNTWSCEIYVLAFGITGRHGTVTELIWSRVLIISTNKKYIHDLAWIIILSAATNLFTQLGWSSVKFLFAKNCIISKLKYYHHVEILPFTVIFSLIHIFSYKVFCSVFKLGFIQTHAIMKISIHTFVCIQLVGKKYQAGKSW